MNICFAFPFMFHPLRGGVERVTDLLAKELKKRGHNIFYLNSSYNPDLLDYKYPATIKFLDETNNFYGQEEVYHDWLNENDIDIVLNQGGIMANFVFFCNTGKSKAKCITVLHNDPAINYNILFREICAIREFSKTEYLKRIYRIFAYPHRKYKLYQYLTSLYAKLLYRSDKICLLSNSYISNFAKFCPKSSSFEKVFSIANPLTYPIQKDILNKEKIVLYVARMDMGQKRPDRMIKIWKRIYKKFPDWKLIVIGDGKHKKKVLQMSKGIGNISFLNQTDPRTYYEKASILCLTSNYEGWPMVLAEAMSFGVVPIAFNSFAALDDMVADNIQKAVPFSINDFCKRLTTIMGNSALRTKLKDRGFEIVKNFTVESIADQWENEFQLLQNKTNH